MSLLDIYHKLPPVLRSVAASGHGYYLRSLRYSLRTEGMVEKAIARESWGADQWKSWHEQRLSELLNRAVKQVPYYREYWAKRRRNGDQSSWERLENWPIVEKEVLRRQPRAFVAEDAQARLFLIQTSGTTGTPLQLWQSRKTLTEWYALVEARSRRWYGVTGKDRWAILGGKLVASTDQTEPPYWVWNQGMRQLYLSSYHLSDRSIPHYLKALRDYRIAYLWGYTSSLHSIAQEILAQNLTPPDLKVIITNAEPVFEYQRETIERAFGCPVRQTYGMAEMAAAAGECEHGSLHLWPEVGYVEIETREEDSGSGQAGDLICTGLINGDMPLIRYRVGDRGSFATPGLRCACGRQLPVLATVEGRRDDVIVTSDGRRIGRLDPILKGNIPIRELQFVQDELESVRVRFVPAPEFKAEDGRELALRVSKYVPGIRIHLEQVDRIPRSANGKFRMVISSVSQQLIAQAKSKGASS